MYLYRCEECKIEVKRTIKAGKLVYCKACGKDRQRAMSLAFSKLHSGDNRSMYKVAGINASARHKEKE